MPRHLSTAGVFGIALVIVGAGLFLPRLFRAETPISSATLPFSMASFAPQDLLVPEALTANDEFSILHFGDAMFDRGVRFAMEAGRDPLVSLPLDEADYLILNLEGPVTESTVCQEKAYSFRFDPTLPQALWRAGVDAVTVANNHSLDCYARGFADTVASLRAAHVVPFGAFTPEDAVTTVAIADRTVALIGIDATTRAVPLPAYQALIAGLSSTTDFQIVSIHWGNEYEKTESLQQRTLAHAFVDAGADAIFGHHPHVVQPVEVYKGVPIFYSLGNFIFDQTDPGTNEGLGAKVLFGRDRVTGFSLYPVLIERARPSTREGLSRSVACMGIAVSGAVRTANYCDFDL